MASGEQLVFHWCSLLRQFFLLACELPEESRRIRRCEQLSFFSSTLLCRLEVGWKLQLGRRECCFHASEALEYSAEQCKNKLEQIYALLSKIAKTCSRFDEHLSRHCKYIPKKLGLTDREGQAGCRISTFLKSHFHFWTLNHLLCACARIPVQAVFPL